MIVVSQKESPYQIMNLNRNWLFHKDSKDVGIKQSWFSNKSTIVERAFPIEIPHTWNVHEPNTNYEGVCWYFLPFFIETFSQDDEAHLYFEAVFHVADVWLNGKYLGRNSAGYIPFEFNVTSALSSREQNLLAVRVDNSREDDRIPARLHEVGSYGWFGYGGIIRPIELRITGKTRIAELKLRSKIEEIRSCLDGNVNLFAEVVIKNYANHKSNSSLLFELINSDGKTVWGEREDVYTNSKSSKSVSLEGQISSAHLWFVDRPYLYTCRISLFSDENILIHQINERFGFREALIDQGCIFLNGEPLRLAGISRHADSAEYGHAEPGEYSLRDYTDILELGCKLVRTGHYLESRAILDFCDENGIFMIPEVPVWQLTANQMAEEVILSEIKDQLYRMVQYAGNRACVLAWSIGNEIESDTVYGRKYVEQFTEFIREVDPSRKVCFASNRLNGAVWRDAVGDFIMMNAYFGTWHGPKGNLQLNLDAITHTWPNKTVIISEWGYADEWELVEGPKIINSNDYYLVSSSGSHDDQRAQLIRDQMRIFKMNQHVAGVIFWTYQDYRVPNWNDPLSKERFFYPMGIVTEQRKRKSSWHALKEEYQLVTIAFGRTKRNQKGTTLGVEIRANSLTHIPAHKLLGYVLTYEYVRGNGNCDKGVLDLPVIDAGQVYYTDLDLPASVREVQCKVIRPGGYSVGQSQLNL